MERCDQCRYAYDINPDELPSRLIDGAAALAARLHDARPEALVRRPEPATWSALELVCHVRDVLLVQRERIVRVLVEDRPSFPAMHRDERVVLERYAGRDRNEVAAEIAVAARLLAGVVTDRTPDELARPCVYNYPAPAERSLLWIGRTALHEAVHHLLDVDRALASG